MLRDSCRFPTTQTVLSSRLPVAEPVRRVLHARVRDELLDTEQFACLAEARVLIDDWREDYSHRRPHSSPGGAHPGRLRRRMRRTPAPDHPPLGSTSGLASQREIRPASLARPRSSVHLV